MSTTRPWRKSLACVAIAALPMLACAQPPGRGGPNQGPPPTAREAAPVDLIGTWVSVVSEDWRWRMVTPVRGDFADIPLNANGRETGLAWDPEADAAAGLECKAYGAPALMRIPGRVRISWQDDETLKIESDAGMQTRLLHFDAAEPGSMPPSRQGFSAANWERPVHGVAQSAVIGVFSTTIGNHPRSLEVKTTDLLPGYLRKNGAPYSADTVLQEYFDYHTEPNGDEWFTVTTIVTDPTYLATLFVTSSDFKKEADDSRWDPEPCSVE